MLPIKLRILQISVYVILTTIQWNRYQHLSLIFRWGAWVTEQLTNLLETTRTNLWYLYKGYLVSASVILTVILYLTWNGRLDLSVASQTKLITSSFLWHYRVLIIPIIFFACLFPFSKSRLMALRCVQAFHTLKV